MEYSRKYWMILVNKINEAIWKEYTTYKNVEYYIKKRQKIEKKYIIPESNFDIIKRDDGKISLIDTLHWIKDFDLILKIAIDLWVETPWFIPAVSYIKNELKENNKNAYDSFMNAFKTVEENPSLSIWLANTTLESIIKTIFDDGRIQIERNKKDTLYSLTEKILKVFKKYPWKNAPEDIILIGSWFLTSCQWIENIRSTKTEFHWKWKNDIVIKDSTYAYFVVNAVSTIWLFILDVYKKNFPEENTEKNTEDLPF